MSTIQAPGNLVGEWLREAGAGLLDLLYPPRCVVCREPGPLRFCAVCRAAIRPAKPTDSPRPSLRGRACVGIYEGPLREAVILLKYHDRRSLSCDLAELMAARLEELRDEWRPDALVPVPIHPTRRRERGYNQSELLAEAIGGLCGLPVRDALERVRNREPQVGRSREERKNVRGDFAPRADVAGGRRPVLIDDVQTTGATLEEAARKLREAGAHVVFALTVCWEPAVIRTRGRAATLNKQIAARIRNGAR